MEAWGQDTTRERATGLKHSQLPGVREGAKSPREFCDAEERLKAVQGSKLGWGESQSATV